MKLYCLLSLILFAQIVEARASWSKLTKDDLENIYVTLKNNHPGYVDENNSYFREWMEAGYLEAKKEAGEAKSLRDLSSVLKKYIAGFADSHLNLSRIIHRIT